MVREEDVPGDVTVEKVAAQVVVDDKTEPAQPVLVPPMEKPANLRPNGFFDPTDPTKAPDIVLLRVFDDETGDEEFTLAKPIAFWDDEFGGIIVPANMAQYSTDLVSVPRFFTWLIPTTGAHLPAALIHDGLVLAKDEPPTYIARQVIDRVHADRVFRSALHKLGTSWVRRWLIWTAVTAATLKTGPLKHTWRAIGAMAATILTVVVLGTLATIDLFDCREMLPWMGDRPAWQEVLFGGLAALVIPILLAPLWGRRWQAGIIAGVSIALLFHVTVGVVLVYAGFTAVDSTLDGDLKPALKWGAIALALTGGIIALGMAVC